MWFKKRSPEAPVTNSDISDAPEYDASTEQHYSSSKKGLVRAAIVASMLGFGVGYPAGALGNFEDEPTHSASSEPGGRSWVSSEAQHSHEMNAKSKSIEKYAKRIVDNTVDVMNKAKEASDSPDAPFPLCEEQELKDAPATLVAADGTPYSVQFTKRSIELESEGGNRKVVSTTYLSKKMPIGKEYNQGKREITDHTLDSQTVTEIEFVKYDKHGNMIEQITLMQGGKLFPNEPMHVKTVDHADGKTVTLLPINKEALKEKDNDGAVKFLSTALDELKQHVKAAENKLPKEP